MNSNTHYTLGLYPLFRNSYRRFCWPWWKEYLTPSTYWRTLKYFFQRGYRGYADCDCWDMDSYLEATMLGMFKRYRGNLMGYPCSLENGPYAPGEEPEGYQGNGMELWKDILDEIIQGLEAGRELRMEDTVPEGTYSDEPLEWEPLPENDKLMRLKDTGTPRFNAELFKAWEAPLLKKRARAGHLIRKHWGSFWD